MFIRFLKATLIALALVFAAQACAVFIEDDEGFHHFHHFHHGSWEHRDYSPRDSQVAENQMPAGRNNLNAARK